MLTEIGLTFASSLCLLGAGAAFFYVPVLGRYIAVGMIALSAGLMAYGMGYSDRGKADRSAAIQSQLDEANRQLRATQVVATAATEREQSAAANADELQKRIENYELQIRSATARPACIITDDDVRGLSDIRDAGKVGTPDASRPIRKPGGGSKAGGR